MRTTNLRATADLVQQLLQTTSSAAHESRRFQRAVKRMPKPMPWDWAAPRLVPFLAGPSFETPGEALVRIRSAIGPMVQFGVDLGGVFVYVDEPVARRWECSPEQLMDRGMRNLRVWSARVPEAQIQVGVMSGRQIRLLQHRPGWASSIILVPDEAFRLFGDHDQILGTPQASCLVSLPIDTPAPKVADILVDFEQSARLSLWLDPFVVIDRRITWTDDFESDDLD